MSTPQAIGPYRVLGRLGAGGMGVVYRVADPHMPRELALKLMNVREASEVAVERFWREAEVLGRIRHRSVVRVHQVGQAPEGPYLLMEVVPGRTLEALLADGPLDPRRAAEVLFELADAVEALHAQGLLHRDIKPGNVIVRDDGLPVLLDFGLVRDAALETLTKTGQTLGTLGYMSPEQLGGESSKHHGPPTDVYALGSILFELLTGERPFEDEVAAVLVGRKLHDDVPAPSSVGPVPRGLDAICRQATRCDPRARYPSAAAFRDDLERYLERGRPRALGPSRVPLVAFGTALALAVALGVWAGSRRGRTQAAAAGEAAVSSRAGWPEAVKDAPALESEPEPQTTEAPAEVSAEAAAEAAASRKQGRTLFQGGDLQGAIDALSRALELQPDAQTYAERGFAYQQLGDAESALADCALALELDPKNMIALGNRAYLEQASDPEAALSDYTRVIQLGYQKPEVFRARGMLRMRLGDDVGASRDRQQAQAMEAKDRLAMSILGALRNQPDVPPEEQWQPPPGPAIPIVEVLERAYRLQGEAEFAQALAAFTRALELDPEKPALLVARATCHLSALDTASALADLDQAIALAPGLQDAWGKRAIAKSLLGDHAGVISDYGRALALGETVDYLVNRGSARQLSGDGAGAIADFTRAIELGDRSPTTLANRGALRVETGDVQGAVRDFQHTLAIDPAFPEAEKMRDYIRQNAPRSP